MAETQTLTNYDENANHYDQFRRPSPVLLDHLRKHFSGAEGPILSVGCGTGRMEQALFGSHNVVGIDRSRGMLRQATNRLQKLIQGDMTQMPFGNDVFSGAYFMQSLHHVGANLDIQPEERAHSRKQALREAIRVVRQGSIIIIQRDPSQNKTVWFWKYFPEALEVKLRIQPKVETLLTWLAAFGLTRIQATPINDPMAKGFFNPKSPLDPRFRRSFSDFSYLSDEQVQNGIAKLQRSIADGSVNDEIELCKQRFEEIGGTVYLIHAKIN